jgi:hypothetical protein
MGQCVEDEGQLSCEQPGPCDGLNVGDECMTPGGKGQCVEGKEELSCEIPNPCEGKQDGDACTSPNLGAGTCQALGDEEPHCEPAGLCDGSNAGDTCTHPAYGEGTCLDFGDPELQCEPLNPCDASNVGDKCTRPNVPNGICIAGGENFFFCSEAPCSNVPAGESCYTISGLAGVCQRSVDGPLECFAFCDGKPNGTECNVNKVVGQCQAGSCATLCLQDNVGEPCIAPGSSGICAEENGKFVCQTTEGNGGGIDGLGVDACGYVYASEYLRGNVWRISPTGEIERLAKVPSGWIPNIKWGRGLGGFSKDIMYVADRDRRRLFAISVGVPGVTEYYDLVSQ